MADEVLNLSTSEPVRPFVVIDGDRHAMLSPHEVTDVTLDEMKRQLQADDDGRLTGLLSVVMPDLPQEVEDRLSIPHRQEIIIAFFDRVFQVATESTQTLSDLLKAIESRREE